MRASRQEDDESFYFGNLCLERCDGGSAVVADLETDRRRIGPADGHTVHVNNVCELRGTAIHGFQIEVDAQAVDRAVKDKVRVAANLAEAARGNSEREVVDGKGEWLVSQVNTASIGTKREFALLMQVVIDD